MFTFYAMNTDVTVAVPGRAERDGFELSTAVAAHFAAQERRFSRFLPDSELSRLNASDGPTQVSPAMFETLLAARRAFELTGGVFDPAVGGALLAAGYDRSFVPGGLDRPSAAPRPSPATFADVALDPATRTVARPKGMTLDLSGLVKGRVVDEAARLLPEPGLVEAGGDARFLGPGPNGDGWLVDVEDPRDPSATLLTLVVREGAVATSAPNRRRWKVGGALAHHLIDPRTGAPAASRLLQVTVVADTAELADVLAKTAFILGAVEGRDFLERQPDVLGLFVMSDGAVVQGGTREVQRA